jgi:hypothetical protein
MGVDSEEDLKRKMIELNLAAARKAQSPQTGYIHLNYDSEDRCDTIPSLENFCFSLALFRSRLADHILEGKAFLEKLLAFEVDGNFPIYLHDFPQCKDRVFSLNLLPVFHWILTDFRAALGETLAVRLEILVGRILSHGYKMHSQRPLSKSAEFKLKSYYEPSAGIDWNPSNPEEWSEALICFQMAKSRSCDQFFKDALQRWHPQLCVYIGLQHHHKSEPKVTLFDLFLGHYYGRYSRRVLEDRRVHLLASLIQPFGDEKCEISSFAIPYHVITYPYVIYWGTPERVNSFVLDPQKAQCSMNKKGENEIEFSIQLCPNREPQKDQEAIEMAFYVNLNSSQKILVQGTTATTFQLGDSVQLLSDDLSLHLEISLERGEGRFFGHLSRANRPTQKAKNLKFETFDWQIALRTICRSEDCSLRVKLKI